MTKQMRSPTLNDSGSTTAKKKARSASTNSGNSSQGRINLTHSSSPAPPAAAADASETKEEEVVKVVERDPVKRLGEHMINNMRLAARSPCPQPS